MAENIATTEVEIFGAVYKVRAEQEGAYLQELATKVDVDMRRIAAHVSQAEPTRIAILAALNIADELFQCRRRKEGERIEISERMTKLAGELASALEGEKPAKKKASRRIRGKR